MLMSGIYACLYPSKDLSEHTTPLLEPIQFSVSGSGRSVGSNVQAGHHGVAAQIEL